MQGNQRKGAERGREILSRAGEQANRILQEAKEDTQRDLEERISQERGSAYQRAQRIISAAELKAGQQVMVTRQALLREVFEGAEKMLSALGD